MRFLSYKKKMFYAFILRGQMNYVNILVHRLYTDWDLELVLRKNCIFKLLVFDTFDTSDIINFSRVFTVNSLESHQG